jgi:NADPH2:quinone reductase
MKAAVIHEFGDVGVLKYDDIPTPKTEPGHILIKVLAAGINRLDHYIREGSVIPELSFPHILGVDAAGEIAELGKGVTEFSVGERVVLMPGFPLEEDEYEIHPTSLAPSFTLPGLGVEGTYAQYIEVPARFVLKDETGLRPEEVATLPVTLATAVRAVKEVGEAKAGDHVLVHSGASGSGSMQIQVAKALGAQVATTVRGDAKGEYAKAMGADLVINTRKGDFVEQVREWTDGRGADLVIDNLGGDVLPRSIDAVKPGGIVVAFGFVAGIQVTFDIRNFFFGQKQLRGSMASDIEDFKWGLEQVRLGKIKPALDHTLPLKDAAKAHRTIANNEAKGNIVLLPWAE